MPNKGTAKAAQPPTISAASSCFFARASWPYAPTVCSEKSAGSHRYILSTNKPDFHGGERFGLLLLRFWRAARIHQIHIDTARSLNSCDADEGNETD
jgi:hypothetical protein